jgi:hypothetical protein
MIADIKNLPAGTKIRRGDPAEEWHGVVVFNNTIKSYSEGYTEEIWGYLGDGFMTLYVGMGLVYSCVVDDEEIVE